MLQRFMSSLLGPADSADSAAPRHRGRRLLVLVLAVAVPAFAAPADWTPAVGDRSGSANLAATGELQPFERPGMSFPGSAFYFLEEAPEAALALPSLDPLDAPVDNAQLGNVLETGPAARAFSAAGSGIDKARALRCMTQAIYYEAASESEAGQRAVAQVVLNRVAHPAWPGSVCGVVFEGSARKTGCQFTFTCDGSLARQPSRGGWDRAQRIAARALSGEVYAPIGLATHYHTNWVNPYWAKSLDLVGTIGAHRFYRWRGRNGTAGAFSMHYAGVETVPSATNANSITPTAADLADRVATTVPARGPAAALAGPVAATPPATPKGDGIYAGAGRVKERYSKVGRWINEPGSASPSAPE